MTDDPTQQYDSSAAGQTPAPGADAPAPMTDASAPASDAAPVPDAMSAADAAPAADGEVASEAPAEGTAVTPVTPVAAGGSKARWFVAIGVAAVAVAAAIGAMFLFSKSSAPEALSYIPADAALVVELRPELPGDQLQAAGTLLAHFPGFQDQSTLTQKIEQVLREAVAKGDGSIDFDKDVKPFLGGPIFMAVQSLEDMATSDEPKNFVVVATINGAAICETTFEGQRLTPQQYNGLTINATSSEKVACAVDGRFGLIGDLAGVKSAIDAHKAGTAMDKSARYAAARTQLGLDRLATFFIDGAELAKALPTTAPNPALADMVGAFPQWIMAGIRAETDALVMDIVVSPPNNPSAIPSFFGTFGPVKPLGFTAFAPADTLVFMESQGFGVQVHNLFGQLKDDPQFSEALKALEPMGGLDGLVGWIDEAGFIVYREGDTPGGAILLAAADAKTASEKVTALETVVGLGALGGEIDVSTSTVEGVKVTTVHIPDVASLAGTPIGPPVPLDLSFAAKDRFIVMGVGSDAMAKVLGVKAGASLAEDAAFKKALARGIPDPQLVIYVAAGATLDWADSLAAASGGAGIPADLKPYLDPLEGFIWTVIGNGVNGSFRMALTVAD